MRIWKRPKRFATLYLVSVVTLQYSAAWINSPNSEDRTFTVSFMGTLTASVSIFADVVTIKESGAMSLLIGIMEYHGWTSRDVPAG